MEFWIILSQILFLLAGAFLFGLLAERLKQSPIIGYLLAGAFIGPWVFDRQAVSELAELGVSLLLFSIGLEFSFSRLKRMGGIAFGGGALQVVVTLILFAVCFSFFRPLGESLAIGAMVAMSSTAVVMRVLVDRAEVDSPRGRNALGILLLQDIAVVPLVIMVSMLGQGLSGHAILLPIAKIILGALGLIVLFYLLFNYLVPLMLKTETIHASRDLVILLAIVIAVGSAWISQFVGLSPALGAFLAGMLLAESPFSGQFMADIGSLRTVFVTLFFTSIGMLIHPEWLLHHIQWVAGGLIVMVVGKILVIYFIARLFGNNFTQSLATGITLAQIGEFSFVLVTAALQYRLINNETFDWVISVTIISIFLTPVMVSSALRIAQQVLKWTSPKSFQSIKDEGLFKPASQQIFVIGFGPAGQKVADALIAYEMNPAVIELRPKTARLAEKKDLKVYMGDAASEDVLLHAGVMGACLAVVTIPDPRAARFIVENIRRIAPQATIIVRGRYNIHNREIEKAGAHLIIDEENLVGEELANAVVGCLKGERSDLECACALAGLPDIAAK